MPRSLPDHWFYAPPTRADAERCHFDTEESRHASKALRLRSGDEIQWMDGVGGRYEGTITDLQRDRMTARVDRSAREAPPRGLRLCVGRLHDAARLEWLVEKATELGATEIVLLDTERVQRTRYRMERLHAKALAATKQSARAYLPQLREDSFEEAVAKTEDAVRLIAHCYEDLARAPLAGFAAQTQPMALFIGPEGDFTREEVVLAEAHQCHAVSLGSARLRTETAAVAALALLALR